MQKLRRSWKLRTLAARFASHPRSFHVSRKVIAQARGLVNPSLVRLGRRGDYDIGRTLVIAGFPRSGTTWLAEMIAAVPGTGILFEPLDFQRLKAARLAGCDWDNFHLPEDTWREGEKYLAEVLAGRVLNGWTTAHLPCSRAWGVSRWIIKFVRANQMLAWLVSRFDILPPVFLIRHPCAVYASITRRGWPTFSYVPNPNSRFYRTYPQFRAVIKGLKTREELFAAQWCKHHYTALDRLDASRYCIAN